MRVYISIPLAALFVFLAAFNVWIMLSGRGATPRSRKIWTQVHRICGYAFIALFIIFSYFMLLRIRYTDELEPRIVLHMALAFILAPLLFAKVLVVRYQKSAWNVLIALGVSILTIAFTLVAMNVAVHYLRNVIAHRVSFTGSLPIIIGAIVAAAIGFFVKSRPPKPPDAPLPPATSSGRQANGADEALNLILARVETQTHDSKTLRFMLPPGKLISPKPGQFLTFDWSIGGNSVKRSYTISSSPTQRNFVEITPKRSETGLVSKFLNDASAVGLAVKARGPYGKFCFDQEQHKRIVLIAAGSGITPMMAMLRYIDDLCLVVPVTLIYCVRSERDVIFENELAAIQKRVPGFHQVLVLSQPGNEWKGWKGRLRREILDREVEQLSESTFFLCGPPPFMDHARSLLQEMGVDPARLLQESFGAGVSAEKPSTQDSGPLQVKLSRSSLSFHMSSNETLLESAEKNGVLIPSGCRQGECGTCATKLLSGNVHMDNQQALTEEMRLQRFILPCVSRPLTDITVDA